MAKWHINCRCWPPPDATVIHDSIVVDLPLYDGPGFNLTAAVADAKAEQMVHGEHCRCSFCLLVALADIMVKGQVTDHSEGYQEGAHCPGADA